MLSDLCKIFTSQYLIKYLKLFQVYTSLGQFTFHNGHLYLLLRIINFSERRKNKQENCLLLIDIKSRFKKLRKAVLDKQEV